VGNQTNIDKGTSEIVSGLRSAESNETKSYIRNCWYSPNNELKKGSTNKLRKVSRMAQATI
jgi:hypothetical protein